MKRPRKCDICLENKRLYFEPDIRFNKNKYWACIRCTGILGLINENPEILYRLLDYLNNNTNEIKVNKIDNPYPTQMYIE